VGQQPGAGDKAYLDPDAVRVLEQHRVVARCPAAFLRSADDRCRHLPQHGRATVHVLARAGSETQVMQTDTLLVEAVGTLRRVAGLNADRGPAADAVE